LLILSHTCRLSIERRRYPANGESRAERDDDTIVWESARVFESLVPSRGHGPEGSR